MVSATTEIMKWSQKLPYWQQYALNHLHRGLPTNSEFYDTVFEFFKEDIGFLPKTLERPVLQVSDSLDFSPRSQQRLKAIGNVSNVNCLATSQLLTIGQNLTTVFGSNGTGKSGYARVIASAGFSRGAKELLPDASKSEAEESDMHAEFLFGEEPVRHLLGKPIPAMSGYFVFDSESIGPHLSKANSLSFSPAGLACLKGLVSVVEEMEQRLNRLVSEKRLPKIQVELSAGNSSVRQFVDLLDAKTDPLELARISAFNESDNGRLSELNLQIAQLLSQDTTAAIKRLESLQVDLKRLIQDIQEFESICSKDLWSEVENAILTHIKNLTAASNVGVEQFKNERLTVIGSPDWDRFVQLSHTLAAAQSSSGNRYPGDGDVCLLCHQDLSEEAQKLLHRTWEYAEGEVQREVGRSALAIESLKRKLQNGTTQYGAERISYEYVQSKQPECLERLSQFTAACDKRITVLRKALENQRLEGEFAAIESSRSDFESLMQQAATEREALLLIDSAVQLNSLRVEQLELIHRKGPRIHGVSGKA